MSKDGPETMVHEELNVHVHSTGGPGMWRIRFVLGECREVCTGVEPTHPLLLLKWHARWKVCGVDGESWHSRDRIWYLTIEGDEGGRVTDSGGRDD